MDDSAKSGIKKGAAIDCPACGKSSIVKVINKMSGWQCVGQVFVCAICGHELGPVVSSGKAVAGSSEGRPSQREALASFLGADAEGPSPTAIGMLGGERAEFCKDCAHYYRNPFKSSCLLHEREVDPMGDCPELAPREKPEGSDNE